MYCCCCLFCLRVAIVLVMFVVDCVGLCWLCVMSLCVMMFDVLASFLCRIVVFLSSCFGLYGVYLFCYVLFCIVMAVFFMVCVVYLDICVSVLLLL